MLEALQFERRRMLAADFLGDEEPGPSVQDRVGKVKRTVNLQQLPSRNGFMTTRGVIAEYRATTTSSLDHNRSPCAGRFIKWRNTSSRCDKRNRNCKEA